MPLFMRQCPHVRSLKRPWHPASSVMWLQIVVMLLVERDLMVLQESIDGLDDLMLSHVVQDP